MLLEAADGAEPLFLQAKKAQPPVLADYYGRSQYANQGEPVVGQHLMPAHGDIFLDWTRDPAPDGVDRDYYVRKQRDWKSSVPIEVMLPAGMTLYPRLCGWILARAYGRSGCRVAVTGYLGSAKFDQAIAEFAETYADQDECDYAALQAAITDGKAQSTTAIKGGGDRRRVVRDVRARTQAVLKRQPGAFAGTIQRTAPVRGRGCP